MTVLGDRMRNLRKEKNKSLAEMSKETGLTRSAISNYENGIRKPRQETLELITDYFNVDTDYLLGRTDVKNVLNLDGIYNAGYKAGVKENLNQINLQPVPVYDAISCGTGSWIGERPESYVGIPETMLSPACQYFANKAAGDSMVPKIHPGDYVVFEESPSIPSGAIGSFSLNGEYYCKRLKRFPNGQIWLYSENTNYQPILVTPEDDFRVLGKYKLRITED
ncbi:helix-turn-helix domain-containing protein [Faecalibaculum rodentium]|uniref:helix-turn-helix domain-containing protein n=1 Tax=Faecalibaculum rodentium TaxID=1702221 RepID=UPI0025A67652|nr:XRE family transcriptional regulator [Faecalibaculum rodentium]